VLPVFLGALSVEINPRVYVSFNTGVSFLRSRCTSKARRQLEPKSEIIKYDEFVESLEKKVDALLSGFNELIIDDWKGSSLKSDSDYTVDTYTIAVDPIRIVDIDGAFGVEGDRDSLRRCEEKMTASARRHFDVVTAIFCEKDGFMVSGFSPVTIAGKPGRARAVSLQPVYITHKDYPLYRARVLNGSGDNFDGQPLEFPVDFFGSPSLLQSQVDDLMQRDAKSNVLVTWHSVYKRPTSENCAGVAGVEECGCSRGGRKTGATFGLSLGVDKTLLREGKDFGLYAGAEVFFEINPSTLRIKNSFEIKSNSMGITPLFGIASKNKWAIYLLCGVKYSFKNLKILEECKKVHRNKLEYDTGVGTTYALSKRLSLSFRYIYTLESSIRPNDEQKIRVHASRVVLSFSYAPGKQ
jgi:hypothetical protein